MQLGNIETFPGVKADKAQALKVLEESAEVYAALQERDERNPYTTKQLLNECADVIMAVSNMVAALGITDFAPYIRACETRNHERGRYRAENTSIRARRC